MNILILTLMMFPSIALADFIAVAGFQGGNLESENFSSKGKPLLRSPIYGFKGEIEFGGKYVTAFVSFDINRGSGKTQYQFTNPEDPSDLASANDLKTAIGLSRLSGGIRFKIIKLRNFRLYLGGGLQVGIISLTHDKEDFRTNTGSSTGFEQNDRANLHGGFGEAGMEFILDVNSGLRLTAQRSFMETDQLKTLNDNKLKFNLTTFALSYIEYIDTGNL